jgi:hypothetical protein
MMTLWRSRRFVIHDRDLSYGQTATARGNMAAGSQFVESLDGFIKCVTGIRDRWSSGTGGYADPWFRGAVQRSRFTVHGTDPRGMEVTSRKRGARLFRVDIRKDAVDRVRLDLITCGITEAVLFPDLGGLARDLRRDHHTLVF